MKRREEKTGSAAEQSADVSLLRTYFVSLFSCLVCCIMFLGTTYAWFSGNVTSASNQIRTGMFQVQLIHEGVDIVENPSHAVFSTQALAPNHNVVTEELTLRNIGDLRLDYEMNLDIVKDDGEIAQYFTVKTKIGEGAWSDAAALKDGFRIAAGELAKKQEEKFSIQLTLNTDAANIQGKELVVVLSLQAQQVLGNGGNA